MLKLIAGIALALIAFSTTVGAARAEAPVVGVPTLNEKDGHFIGLSGPGLQTLVQSIKIWISVRSTETTFTLDVFDGNLGGLWDEHDPRNLVQTQFLLYADPTKSGNPAGKTQIASSTSPSMADNAWTPLFTGAVHPAARAPSGHYFYLLVVQWNDPSKAANEFNGFKVRASGQVSITPGQWAFVGAPINLESDPPKQSANNAYDGHWDFFFFAPPASVAASRTLTVTEGDADYRLAPPPNAGNPPDDGTDQRLVIPPDIRYTVFDPGGQVAINNTAPSGNNVFQTRTAPIQTGGMYRWTWLGVDAHNLVFVNLLYETSGVNEPPLTTDAPPPTPTPTNTPVPPTATPQPPPPPPPPPPDTPTPVPPAATATPVPTATPTPTPSPLFQIAVLPKTGGDDLLLVVIAGALGLPLLVTLGVAARAFLRRP